MTFTFIACALSCLLGGGAMFGLWRWRSRRLAAEIGRVLRDPLGTATTPGPHLRLKPFGEALASLEAELRAGKVELKFCRSVLEATEAHGSSALEHTNAELERRNAELQGYVRRLEQTQVQLALADRLTSLGTLTAGVAHEINNPLAYVLSNLAFSASMVTELAQDSCGCVGGADQPDVRLEELRQALAESQEGAERVRTIVRDLRMFSRAEDQTTGPVDLKAVLTSALGMAAHETRRRAQVVTEFGEIPLVDGNGGRLVQVFLNLIINAAQAMAGPVEKNQLRVRAGTDVSGGAVVEIIDNGEGIPPAIQARIFEPFFTTKPVGVGTGLGLSICHGIITGSGGSISVTSAPGQGTTFTVILPALGGAHREGPPDCAAAE